MNDLTIIKNEQGQLLVDSREVAQMIGKRHSDLLESIKGYIGHLTNGKFRSSDFFIESTYVDTKGETRICYLLTRKGCDMVANKMTGEKGILFTAAYVTKFEEMEQQFKPTCIEDVLISSLQEMKALKNEVQAIKKSNEETKEEIQGIRDVVALTPNAWRKDTTTLISKIAMKLGGFDHIKDVREESYKLLNDTYKVDVKRRLSNKKKNMAFEGVRKSQIDKLNPLDVIAEDEKLINGYISIISKMAIKYGAV